MLSRRTILAASVTMTALVAATPVFAANWPASGVGTAAVKAGTVATPGSLTISCSNTGPSITFGWGTVTGASSYDVYRATDAGSFAVDVSGTTSTSITETGTAIPRNHTYHYEVLAHLGTSTWKSALTSPKFAGINNGGNCSGTGNG